jgi:hypothetical protein
VHVLSKADALDFFLRHGDTSNQLLPTDNQILDDFISELNRMQMNPTARLVTFTEL